LFSIVFNLQCSTNCAEIPIYTKGVAEAAPDPELLNIEAQVLAYYDQKKCGKYCSKRWSWWKMQLAEYLEDLMENMCELEEKNFFFIFIDPWNIIFRDILLATEPEVRSITFVSLYKLTLHFLHYFRER